MAVWYNSHIISTKHPLDFMHQDTESGAAWCTGKQWDRHLTLTHINKHKRTK